MRELADGLMRGDVTYEAAMAEADAIRAKERAEELAWRARLEAKLDALILALKAGAIGRWQ